LGISLSLVFAFETGVMLI